MSWHNNEITVCYNVITNNGLARFFICFDWTLITAELEPHFISDTYMYCVHTPGAQQASETDKGACDYYGEI